ncbi:hypothetical protein [Actinoplanes couchii]|uniref:Uncharacterized protein n=1 Tax=Actinoplanes couchii TaxID=403638 RepID=A0ABQ3XF18_9ACTN|nr:hypothetical protein [Actinoplanes couchii]MDR6321941.1 hypothetical protein [Actinoplanes couchii]GID57102.1 hypothetical protein Aco03nite_055060 [Actinoplanes couchii]
MTRWLRYPILALALYLTGYALIGPRGPENPAAHALFVWLWVGLVLAGVILGPIWRGLNPLRTIFTLLRLPPEGLRPLGSPGSTWPATAYLLLFVAFELVVPHHGDPVAVGLFLLLYGLAQVVSAAFRGEEWFARGDCFEVYSDLAGRLSPLRRPGLFSGLATPALPGVAAFVAVWWGSTVFDSAGALWGAPGLILFCAAVYLAVRWTAGRLDVTMSLIPIAAAYTLAHYLSLLVVEAPRGVLLLVGAAPGAWDPRLIPEVIAAIQIALILIGHAIGVLVAHDRALAESPSRPPLAVLADEFPLVLFMIACTWTGLYLLFVR